MRSSLNGSIWHDSQLGHVYIQVGPLHDHSIQSILGSPRLLSGFSGISNPQSWYKVTVSTYSVLGTHFINTTFCNSLTERLLIIRLEYRGWKQVSGLTMSSCKVRSLTQI